MAGSECESEFVIDNWAYSRSLRARLPFDPTEWATYIVRSSWSALLYRKAPINAAEVKER